MQLQTGNRHGHCLGERRRHPWCAALPAQGHPAHSWAASRRPQGGVQPSGERECLLATVAPGLDRDHRRFLRPGCELVEGPAVQLVSRHQVRGHERGGGGDRQQCGVLPRLDVDTRVCRNATIRFCRLGHEKGPLLRAGDATRCAARLYQCPDWPARGCWWHEGAGCAAGGRAGGGNVSSIVLTVASRLAFLSLWVERGHYARCALRAAVRCRMSFNIFFFY